MNTAPLPPPYLGRQPHAEHDPFAPVDPVTHVWSRNAILQVAARMLDAARKEGQPVGFLLLSVDPTHSIRGMYGPAMADAVLREVCRRVRKAMGSADAIGRTTRDELLIVLPTSGSEEAVAAIAERILCAVKDEAVMIGAVPMAVSMAVGATLADASAPLDEVIVAADAALHNAKVAGCDRVEVRWPTATARLLEIS